MQVAHDQDVDEDAEKRREDEEDEREGEDGRPALVDGQFPVRESGDHANGAVGEVEDARRDVGDNEAGGAQGVDAADDDADDGERQERRHGAVTLTA